MLPGGRMPHAHLPRVFLSCSALALAGCAAATPSPAPAAPPAAVAVPAPAEGEPTPAAPPRAACEGSEDFEAVWPRLRAHLEAGIEGVTPLIDPERGVFVIDNPGAFTIPMHVTSLMDAVERVPKLTAEHYRWVCPEVHSDKTPHFSCETDQWSARGCVMTPNPEFSVARWYELAIQYELLPPAEARAGLEQARKADLAIEMGVYATDATIGFYFGRVGCAWRVLAVDAVTPCSA